MKWMQMTKLLLLACWLSGFAPVAQAFYHPDSGRRLSRDPIEEQDGPNQHAFLHNGPVNKVDLDGRTGWQLPPQLNQDREFTEGYWRGAGDAALPCMAVATLLTPVPGDEGVAFALIAKRFEKILNSCKPCKNFRCDWKIFHRPHHWFPAPGNPKKKAYRYHIHIRCWDKQTKREIINKIFPFGSHYKQAGGHGGDKW